MGAGCAGSSRDAACMPVQNLWWSCLWLSHVSLPTWLPAWVTGLMLLMQKWCPLANVIPAGRTEQALRTEWLCLSSVCPVGIGGAGIKPTSYKHYCSEATPPVLPGSVWVRSVSLWPPMCSDPWKPLTLGSGTWTELSTGSGRYHNPAG